jgi:hypothetical protein
VLRITPPPGLPRREKSAESDERFPNVADTAMAEIDDARLRGLIAYLLACHGGGFVNNIIKRDELLSVLEELKTRRDRSGRDGDLAS